MTPDPPDRDALAALLRSLPAPEPSADFLAGAGRLYAQALETRHRRHVLVVLMAASGCLATAAGLFLVAFDPAALLGSGAVAIAELTRWGTAAAAVVSIVPPEVWESMVILFIASTLPVLFLARAHVQRRLK